MKDENYPRKVYWHCLDGWESGTTFVEDCLDELAANLKKPPIDIIVETCELPADKVDEVISCLSNASMTLYEKGGDIGDILCQAPGKPPGLLVCCQDEALTKQAADENPNARWGTKAGRLAVVFKPGNKHLIWHETLHLLGAMDCYNEETGEGSCELPRCIMQHAPTEESVAPWPDCLCVRNIVLLREGDTPRASWWIAKMKGVKKLTLRPVEPINPIIDVEPYCLGDHDSDVEEG